MNLATSTDYDPQAWDEFVSAQPSGHFMQSYGWGQFQRYLGWEPRYCVLTNGGEVRAAVLVLSRKVPGLPARIFHAPRGPAVRYSDRETTQALFSELSAYVAREKGVLMRFDPYWTEQETSVRPMPSALKKVPRDWSDWNAPRFLFWLDLEGDEDDVMMRMPSKTRNDIRRGYRNNVEFETGSGEDFDEFYRLMVLTGQEKDIAHHGKEYYQELHRVVNDSAAVQLFLGRYEGEVVTTGVSVVYGDKAWLLYAATSPDHYDLRATRTQQWEMIKWAHGRGCKRYDFRGTATGDPPSKDDPGYGVYKFKGSFGPEFTRMAGYFDIVNRPLLYRGFRFTEDHLLPLAYRLRTWTQ